MYLILLIFLILLVVFQYNSLISTREKVHEAWSGIDVQLKRRHDLIPNLVETVKAYEKHEKELFERIAQERAIAVNVGSDIQKRSVVEDELVGSVRSILMLSEAYPQLQADKNFLQLQEELSETEDQIASARRIYNSNVARLNSLIGSFPTNLMAATLGISKEEFFNSGEQVTTESSRGQIIQL